MFLTELLQGLNEIIYIKCLISAEAIDITPSVWSIQRSGEWTQSHPSPSTWAGSGQVTSCLLAEAGDVATALSAGHMPPFSVKRLAGMQCMKSQPLSVSNALPNSVTFTAADWDDNGTPMPNCNSLPEETERIDGALRYKIKEEINENPQVLGRKQTPT